MEQLKDPDYLCNFALTLKEVNPAAHRNCRITPKVKFSTPSPDSYKPRSKIVAFGATQDSLGHIKLYVAGNSDLSPKVVDHLNTICTRLVDIQAAINAAPNPSTILHKISRDPRAMEETTDLVFLALRELHGILYKYSLIISAHGSIRTVGEIRSGTSPLASTALLPTRDKVYPRMSGSTYGFSKLPQGYKLTFRGSMLRLVTS